MARILVVDDDPVVLRMLAYVLVDDGYEARRASDGLVALDLLEREAFDLVVSDVRMPQLDGLGLLARIRGDERLAHLPVILLTAQFDAYDKVQPQPDPLTIFLQKPLSSNELAEAVARQLVSAEG
ncbi:MAG: response regulator [Anaerolineae bacterium]|nr:response regulator [Anaerolineae bacterium]